MCMLYEFESDSLESLCSFHNFGKRFLYGLDPGIGLGSTRSLRRDPRNSSLFFPGATSPVCRVSPTNRCANVYGKVGSIMCSHTQSIHFLSYLVFSKPNIPISSFDFDKMKMRKNSEIRPSSRGVRAHVKENESSTKNGKKELI